MRLKSLKCFRASKVAISRCQSRAICNRMIIATSLAMDIVDRVLLAMTHVVAEATAKSAMHPGTLYVRLFATFVDNPVNNTSKNKRYSKRDRGYNHFVNESTARANRKEVQEVNTRHHLNASLKNHLLVIQRTSLAMFLGK
ncbi:unnamed protein product, partial [Brenthis ino]